MKIINSFLLLLVLFSLLSSCEKDNTNSGKSNDDYKSITPLPCSLEQYGISHNLWMDYIANKPNFNFSSIQEVYSYSYGYSDNYFTPAINQDYTQHSERRLLCFSLIEKPLSAGNILFNEGLIGFPIINLIDSFALILDNAASCENGTFLTVQEFTNSIISFENYINSHYVVEYDESTKMGNSYALLLGACSISRKSYQYWMNAGTDQNHLWYSRFEQITYDGGCGNAKWPDWVKKAWHGVKVAAVDSWAFLTCDEAFTPDYGYDPYGNRVIVGGSYNLGSAFQYAGEQSSTVP